MSYRLDKIDRSGPPDPTAHDLQADEGESHLHTAERQYIFPVDYVTLPVREIKWKASTRF